MKPVVAIILNPNSRMNKKTNCSIIKDYNKIGGTQIKVWATKDFNELESAIKEIMGFGINYLAISGGDGTIHQTITMVKKIYGNKSLPKIVILRDGTMNNVGRTMNLKGNGRKILKKLLYKLNNNIHLDEHPRALLEIDGRYGFLFGMGVSSNFLEAAYEGNKGTLQNIKVIKSCFAEAITGNNDNIYKKVDAEIWADNQKMPFNEVTGVLAGTVEHIGMGFHPLSRAATDTSKFQVIASAIEPIKLARYVIDVRHGWPIKHELHFDGLVEKLDFVSPEPFTYTIDGDLYIADKKLHVGLAGEIILIKV